MLGLLLRKLPAPLRAILIAAAGVFLIYGAIHAWTGPGRCDGTVAAGGQLCQRSDGSLVTAAQALDEQNTHAWFSLGAGVVLLGVAAYTLMRPQRTRR